MNRPFRANHWLALALVGEAGVMIVALRLAGTNGPVVTTLVIVAAMLAVAAVLQWRARSTSQ
ncbi:MAG: hypothetical protein SGJ11_13845 [Phycisphaerae bacterium]|nr:hypothetical protein [Phycisphaerae bacterium]